MNTSSPIRAAFVGFGEVNTPREFIEARCATAADALRTAGLDLVEAGPVADDPAGQQADRAGAELEAGTWDTLVLCVAGWIPSWAVFRVIDRFRHKPMVLLGLSGWRAKDGKWVTTADQAGTTALRLPMAEAGFRFRYIVTRRGEPVPVDEVARYCLAATTAARLRRAVIGMAGYRDMRLYGTLYDGLSLKRMLGVEIEHFDLLEIQQLMAQADEKAVRALAKELPERWDFRKDPQPGTVENSIRLGWALKQKIEDRGYAAFSFADVDGIKRLMGFAPAGALTFLHDELDVPTVPENDSLGAVTQVIMKALTGQISAYLEFYEFTQTGALMGVPDYVPAEIVDGRVTVLPNAFGDFGEGLLNVSRLKTGRVTLARLAMRNGRYVMHAATGEARTPETWEEAGWAPPAPQLPSLDIVFDAEAAVEAFIQHVMSQHYILTYGEHIPVIKDLCAILGIEVIRPQPPG